MTIGTLLLSLTGIILGTNGQLLERAPIPGVVSVPYSRSSPQLQKRDAVVEAAFGSLEAPYIVNITAGTPPQPITVSLDTGSSDLVLRTGESTFCMAEPAGVCPGVGYYNANKSSTYKYLNSNYVSVYGFVNQSQSTGAKGDVATDTFTFGGTTVKNQQFDIAYGNSTISLSILGLGYASAESQVFTSPVQPPYDNFPLSLAKQGATNLALFSLWKNAVDSHDGEILFGGVDTAKYTGSLTTLETQNRTGENEILGFDVLLNGVALSGNSSFPKGSTGSVSAVLDCGTSYSILPDDWVQPIYDQFDITYFQDNDTAYVDCALETEKYTINYIFESLTIQVPISAMVVLRAINPYICSFGLVPAGTRLPLLGENFLSSSYAVFDLTNNQISLATRDFSSTTDNVIAVPAKGVKGIDSSGMNPSPSGTATGTGSGTTSGTGTATGSGASPTTSKKSSASSVTFSTCVVGISLLIILSLRSLF